MEAPFIYAAIDALAARAMAWAERRQRMLLDAHPDDASLLSPAEAASAASIAIKEVLYLLLVQHMLDMLGRLSNEGHDMFSVCA